jgi:ABC-type sugar transport system ATPase subunit
MIPDISIERNITFGVLDKLTSHGFVNEKMERYISRKWIRQLSIESDPNDASDAAEDLDKCKAVIARLLAAHPRVLVIDNPMRGIVYELRARVMDYIRKMTSEGTTVLILSTVPGELIQSTDRVMMLSKNGMQIELEDNETSACFNNNN